MLRRIHDSSIGANHVLSDLMCLDAMLTWPDFVKDPYKKSDIVKMLELLISNQSEVVISSQEVEVSIFIVP